MKNCGGSGRGRSAGVCGALALMLCACTREIDPPSAGQTGSPVAPDHESPGQFRPPQRPDNPGGGAPIPRPWRPLPGNKLTASFGDWLYVATPRGLFAYDTSDASAAPVTLLNDASFRWFEIVGTTLDVISEGVPDDPAQAEQGLVTRISRFELEQDPTQPVLLGSMELPGGFLQARREGERLITLTGEPEAARCSPERGPQPSYLPERMSVSELALHEGAWSEAHRITADAIGFVELENAFVLVDMEFAPSDVTTLTVVVLGADGIEQRPALRIDGEAAPDGTMALAGQRLALFQIDRTRGTRLAVYDTETGSELGALTLTADTTPDDIAGATFDGRFVLLPSSSSDGQRRPGRIFDWQADGGPRTSGELPADLATFERVDGRWLGRGSARFVLLQVSDAGGLQLEAVAEVPAGATRAPHLAAQAGASLLVPYVVDGRERRLGRLDLGSSSITWQAGPRITGDPTVYTASSLYTRARQGLSIVSTARGAFALTIAGDPPGTQWLLERIDLGAEQSEVVAFAERVLATAAQSESQVTLLGSYEETRRLRVTHDDGRTAEVALGNGAEQLSSFGAGLLASSIEYSNGCYRGTGPRYDDTCLPAGNPALSVISLDPFAVVSEATLPVRDADIPGAPFSREWLEVVSQAERVGVLEHSSIVCRSRAACETLGVPFDPRGPADSPSSPEQVGVGSQNQRWLHAYDSESASFDEPVHLFDVDGYGWLSAENLRVDADAGAALTLFTPLVLNPNGNDVDRARIELVRYRDLSSAALGDPTRITVPGYPLHVGARRAVTIEPAGALGSNGEAPVVLVHRLALDGEVAYLEQTLELGRGGAGQRWANTRGYVLLVGDDRCAEPTSTLVSVRLVGDRLEEAGRVTLPGTSWQLSAASDSVALLARGLEGLVQHAVIDAAERELSLREYRTYPGTVPVSVWEDRVWFETGP